MGKVKATSVEISINERVDGAGFAYFKDARGEGRVTWVVEEGPRNKYRLQLSSSWGFPMDATLALIRAKLIHYLKHERGDKAPLRRDEEGLDG